MSRSQDLKVRINQLVHSIQSAISFGFGDDPNPTREHKHLRVGIDNALISHSALTALLIAKGVITEEEYLVSYVDFLEREVKDYEDKAKALGQNITFS